MNFTVVYVCRIQLISSKLICPSSQVLQRKQPKKRKERTAMHPILGAVLKFHKDDDDTPPPSPGGAGNAC
jgi:hypothetical protein